MRVRFRFRIRIPEARCPWPHHDMFGNTQMAHQGTMDVRNRMGNKSLAHTPTNMFGRLLPFQSVTDPTNTINPL
jgi:hypothetical protein